MGVAVAAFADDAVGVHLVVNVPGVQRHVRDEVVVLEGAAAGQSQKRRPLAVVVVAPICSSHGILLS